MTLHFFPTPNARDPRTDPRIGDELQVNGRIWKVLGWRDAQGFTCIGWAPGPSVEEVRYLSGRSERWISMASWLALARGAEVVEAATDPALNLRP